jgi:transposase-like protein
MPAERTTMRYAREVLRLKFVGGVPTREIARRLGIAPSTARTTIRRFQAAGLSWLLPDGITDGVLEARLFPEASTKQGHRRQGEPTWASVHRELKRKSLGKVLIVFDGTHAVGGAIDESYKLLTRCDVSQTQRPNDVSKSCERIENESRREYETEHGSNDLSCAPFTHSDHQ